MMKGLEKITDAIVGDAKDYSKSVLFAAKFDAEKTLASYREKADKMTASVLAKAGEEADMLLRRCEEGKEVAVRHELLRAKGEAIDRAFELALEKLKEMKGEKKLGFLTKLSAKALDEALESEKANRDEIAEGEIVPVLTYELILNETDRRECGAKIVESLSGALKQAGKTLVLAPAREMEGGVMLKCGDVVNNCSLTQLLSLVRREKEGQIASLMFPAKKN